MNMLSYLIDTVYKTGLYLAKQCLRKICFNIVANMNDLVYEVKGKP